MYIVRLGAADPKATLQGVILFGDSCDLWVALLTAERIVDYPTIGL
jgi:hypothetical protein